MMLDQFLIRWEKLRTSFWPVPAGMLLLALLLLRGAAALDAHLGDEPFLRTWWLHSGSGSDARNLLSTVVTAIITMASVVFSITVVVLSLAANQFGSRLVRTYMSNVPTKVALGLFLMTIAYCLLALRSVQEAMSPVEVPHVTVTAGLVLALTCVVALVFFLHVVARSIVADEVIKRTARELEESIRELPCIDDSDRQDQAPARLPEDFESRSVILTSAREGYVQAVEHDRLMSVAVRHRLLLRLDFKPGEFVSRDGWLGAIYPREAAAPELADAIRRTILVGQSRTPTQDLEFSIRHLTDVALRALSPAINDPNTGMVVIDRLRAALSELMSRRLPSSTLRDQSGTARIFGRQDDHAAILEFAFHQIREAGARHPLVMVNMLDAIGKLAEHVRLAAQYEALRRQAGFVAAAGLRELSEPTDKESVQDALVRVERKLDSARAALAQAHGGRSGACKFV